MDISAATLDLLHRQIGGGHQIGVQVAAYRYGEQILDVAAGTMGPDDERTVQSDSLFLSFSSTKGPAALVLHQLADRNLLDYDKPVATYWPEFAQHGKANITVAQAMSHQAGLHAMPSPFDVEHLTDWDAALARTAAATPAWEPGTATGYHAVTYGWIVGGIVRGITGRHFSDVAREFIAEPLGIADEFYVGIPDTPSVTERLTTLDIVAAGDGLPIPDDSAFYAAMPKAMWPHFNSMDVRRAAMPAANGHFTARALARIYGALANGGVIDGHALVTPQQIALMQTVQTRDVDIVLGTPILKSTGFMLGGPTVNLAGETVHGPAGPRRTAFGHSGAGGSIGFADPELGLGVAVTLNKMAFAMPGEGTTVEICDLIRSAL
jgi:CubicO group peptidase (beta-lactamase class C family)